MNEVCEILWLILEALQRIAYAKERIVERLEEIAELLSNGLVGNYDD